LFIGIVLPGFLVNEEDSIFHKSVVVCGSSPSLGNWDCHQAPRLKAAPAGSFNAVSTENGREFLPKSMDPFAFRYACVPFNSLQPVSYKYVLMSASSVHTNASAQWEGSGPEHNRELDFSKIQPITREDAEKFAHLKNLDVPDNDLPFGFIPVVHWNDLQERSSESYHSSVFAAKVLQSKSFYATQVTDQLWVGSCPRRIEHVSGALRQIGVTVVLNLQELADIKKHCPIETTNDENNASLLLEQIYQASDIQMVFLPTRDMSPSPKRHSMVPSALILASLINNGHIVYVHCNCGIGRAIGAVCSYLVCSQKWTPEASNFYINMIRPISYCDVEGLTIAQNCYVGKFGERSLKKGKRDIEMTPPEVRRHQKPEDTRL